MRRYQQVVRWLFAVIFIAGGVAHLILGRVQPEGYAVFADTALFPWLSSLWASFVMPNIAWLTIILGLYEIACGIAVLIPRTLLFGVAGMIVFLACVTILGYGLPALSPAENMLKNRLVTLVMIGMLIPVLPAAIKAAKKTHS